MSEEDIEQKYGIARKTFTGELYSFKPIRDMPSKVVDADKEPVRWLPGSVFPIAIDPTMPDDTIRIGDLELKINPSEEKSMSEDLDAMWEVLKELSDSDGRGPWLSNKCVFCHAENDYISNLKHEPTCLISRAYKLVWEKENREWHERKRENKASIKVDRLDGSCPVQATGTIGDHSAFYFRGRHEAWQFTAGPKELSTDDLVKVQLKFIQDPDVFVLEGDDDERMYQDYDHVRSVLQDYAQQYVEWMSKKEKA